MVMLEYIASLFESKSCIPTCLKRTLESRCWGKDKNSGKKKSFYFHNTILISSCCAWLIVALCLTRLKMCCLCSGRVIKLFRAGTVHPSYISPAFDKISADLFKSNSGRPFAPYHEINVSPSSSTVVCYNPNGSSRSLEDPKMPS